jgi:methylated-DNA-[protein]-cysteine S-methyltransferase
MRQIAVFRSALGWMAMVGQGRVLEQLTFGHPTSRAARAALDSELTRDAAPGTWNSRLIARLQAYAAGRPDDFSDVPVDTGAVTEFRRRVLDRCRRIPYGKTLTYQQLAASVGSAGAARAVGNAMAANRVPLVIPCHRVVPSGGRLGGFSAPGGTRMKQRLLDLEAHASV